MPTSGGSITTSSSRLENGGRSGDPPIQTMLTSARSWSAQAFTPHIPRAGNRSLASATSPAIVRGAWSWSAPTCGPIAFVAAYPLIRRKKEVENYEPFLHPAFAIIALR
jgi:hypothetical protein